MDPALAAVVASSRALPSVGSQAAREEPSGPSPKPVGNQKVEQEKQEWDAAAALMKPPGTHHLQAPPRLRPDEPLTSSSVPPPPAIDQPRAPQAQGDHPHQEDVKPEMHHQQQSQHPQQVNEAAPPHASTSQAPASGPATDPHAVQHGGVDSNGQPTGQEDVRALESRRKESHKEVEKRRRENINQGISKLLSLLPPLPFPPPGAEEAHQAGTNGSASADSPYAASASPNQLSALSSSRHANKAVILESAANYIQHLKDVEANNLDKWTLEKLMADQAKAELRHERDYFRSRMEHLERLLQESHIPHQAAQPPMHHPPPPPPQHHLSPQQQSNPLFQPPPPAAAGPHGSQEHVPDSSHQATSQEQQSSEDLNEHGKRPRLQ